MWCVFPCPRELAANSARAGPAGEDVTEVSSGDSEDLPAVDACDSRALVRGLQSSDEDGDADGKGSAAGESFGAQRPDCIFIAEGEASSDDELVAHLKRSGRSALHISDSEFESL